MDVRRGGRRLVGRRGGVLRGGLGTEGEEDQGAGPADEHDVGDVEDGPVEAHGVDVEVDEVADVAEGEAVVTVADRAGHDEAEGHGQRQARRRAADEPPADDRRPGRDREPREDQAAVRHAPAEAPERPLVVAGAQLQDLADHRDRGRARLARLPEDDRLARQVQPRAAEGEGQEQEESARGDAARHSGFSSFRAHSMQYRV